MGVLLTFFERGSSVIWIICVLNIAWYLASLPVGHKMPVAPKSLWHPKTSAHFQVPLRDVLPLAENTTIYIAVLFMIVKRWKQPKRPSADEHINKKRHIHTMECYSVLKWKEILIQTLDESWGHYTKWNKPVTKKTNIVWCHLYELSRI